MGGSGSDCWCRWGARETTDSQNRVDIRWLKKQNLLHPGTSGSLSWSMHGEKTGSIGYIVKENKMILKYRHRPHEGDWEDVKQAIYFDKTPCQYGGYRKWFLCPHCGKRVAILYGTGKNFFCRCCCQLTYESCNSCDLQRILNKSYKLKKKIGGEPILHSWIPDRPKGMHHKTYNKIKTEIHRLEALGEQGMIQKWGHCF